MTRVKSNRFGLASLYTGWLVGLFILLEIITISAALKFVLLPLSERAADDMAGMMTLSAHTWLDLPPQDRSEFERHLHDEFKIAINPDLLPAPDTGLRHGWYLLFLERALEKWSGREIFFMPEVKPNGSHWLWATIPIDGEMIGIGFQKDRLRTQPLIALSISLVLGTLLILTLSKWLAARIVQPITRFEKAAADLSMGGRPERLPETGPRELADLAGHFNHMALQMHELCDARTNLFAGLSHDLRTPLARMRLALEMLTLKPSQALLDRLELDIEEINRLIGQLLETARGLKTEAAQSFDLSTWLQTRIDAHAATARAAESQLILGCDPALRAYAPPDMLSRVLDNLLGNALRYAPGPIELVGQALPAQSDGKGGSLRIGVLDRGPGIPPDQLEAVFRPFHRLEDSRNKETGGFGLGLAIVQQLAQANGWDIVLEARQGGGLSAWVEMPTAPQSA